MKKRIEAGAVRSEGVGYVGPVVPATRERTTDLEIRRTNLVTHQGRLRLRPRVHLLDDLDVLPRQGFNPGEITRFNGFGFDQRATNA